MQFNDYADWTDNVAVYPKVHEPHYLALGIAEELGELHRAMRTEDLIAEAGDVIWYCARYARLVLKINFDDVCTMSVDEPIRSAFAILQPLSVIAGVEKKRLRDGETWDAEKLQSKHQQATIALAQIAQYTFRCCRLYANTEPEAVLAANVAKLSARKQASTIQGDGDHR